MLNIIYLYLDLKFYYQKNIEIKYNIKNFEY